MNFSLRDFTLAVLVVVAVAVVAACLPVGRCHNEQIAGTARYIGEQDGQACFLFEPDDAVFCPPPQQLPPALVAESGRRYRAECTVFKPPCSPGRSYRLLPRQ
jgi:hypothetical protein